MSPETVVAGGIAIRTLRSCGSPPSADGEGNACGPSSSRASSAARSVDAFLKRLSASLASIRDNSAPTASGASGHTWWSLGGSSKRILASTAITCSAWKGGSPVMHSNSTHPSEKTSAAARRVRSPRTCSGAM